MKLEQIVPTYCIETAADETTREIGAPGHDVTVIKWATEFSRRLVAELAKQEPVGEVDEVNDGYFAQILLYRGVKKGQELYTAPIPTPEDVRDAERYRYLRDCDSQTSAVVVANMNEGVCGVELDNLIQNSIEHDTFYGLYAAMTAAQEGK